MRITRHFKLDEFHCRDGTEYPDEWLKYRLLPLCQQLELIRSHFGNRPISITSGYRTVTYNRKVGGVQHSQHIQGRAADIKVKGISARRVAGEIRELIRQGILQVTGLGSYHSFTHIDMRPVDRLAYWRVFKK